MRTLFAGLWKLGTRALPVGLGLLCLFASQAILGRLVGVETFGAYGYALTWIMGAALIARAGYEWAVIKRVPQLLRVEAVGAARHFLVHVYRAVSLRAIALAAAVTVVMMTSQVVAPSLGLTTAMAAGLLIVVLALGGVSRASALAYGNTWLAETPEAIVKPTAFILGVAGLIAFAGTVDVAALIWLNLAITLVVTISGTALLIQQARALRVATPKPEDLKDSRSVMRAMWLTTVLNMILRNGDVLVIGALADATTTGLYIAASRLAAVAGAPVGVLDQVVAPRIAVAHDAGDKRGLRQISFEYALLAGLGCVAFLVLLSVFGSGFVTAIFGEEFRDSAALVWILLIGHAANSLTGPTGILLSMTGSHRLSVVVALISAAAFLLLLWVLTPIYLAVGAAIAYSAAAVIKNSVQIALVIRRLGINPTVFPADLLKPAIKALSGHGRK